MSRFRQRKAFTIVEMVIVIAVIAILATVLVPTISGVIQKANHSTDVQFAANLNVQLAMYAVDKPINNESDLRDAINYFYGDWEDEEKTIPAEDGDFYAKLAPKSAKQGYHYWWDAEEKVVKVLDYKALSEIPGVVAEEDPYPFAPGNPRTLANGRFFMMDRAGSQLADLMGSLNNVNDVENDVNNYENVIARIEAIEGDDQPIAALMLNRLNEIGIVNSSGMFVFPGEGQTSATVKYIYIPANDDPATIKVLGKELVGADTVDVTAVKYIDLPQGVAVGSSSLLGFTRVEPTEENPLMNGSTELRINATLAEVQANNLVYKNATNCVVVLSDGSRYVFKADGLLYPLPLVDENGNPSDPAFQPSLSDGVTQFDIYCTEDDGSEENKACIDRLETGDILYVAFDQKTYHLTAAGFNSNAADTSVTWSIEDTDCPHSITSEGVLTLGDPGIANQKGSWYEFEVTATAVYGGHTETITVLIDRASNVAFSLGGVEKAVNFAISDNAIDLIYNGTETSYDFALGTVTRVNSGYVKCSEAVTLTLETMDDPVFEVSGNTLTRLKNSGTQKLTVNYGGHIEEVFTITLEDRSTSPIVNKFPNTNTYLYRVGNANTVKLSSLFAAADGVTIDSSTVTVEVYDAIESYGKTDVPVNKTNGFDYAYTANTTTWGNGTIKFTGTGVAKIVIGANGRNTKTTLYVEVVDGENITSLKSVEGGNLVLLNDVGTATSPVTSRISITNGILYGNGFNIYANKLTGKNGQMISLNSGTLDNVIIHGPVYPELTWNDTYDEDDTKGYFINGIAATGNSTISNSFISGFRAPVRLNGGVLNVENTTLSGGAYGNMEVTGGNLIITDLTTVQEAVYATVGDTSKTVLAAGIVFSSEATANSTVTINGYLKQYNWICSSDKKYLPSDYQTAIGSLLSNDEYVHKDANNEEYVNTGIIFLGQDMVPSITNNRTDGRDYGNIVLYGVTLYTVKPGTNSQYSKYTGYAPSKQMLSAPSKQFNAFAKAETDTDKYYAYAENGKVYIRINEANNQTYTINAANLLTLKKYGVTLEYATIECSGTALDNSAVVVTPSNGNLTFSRPGEYTIYITVTDNRVYDHNGNPATGRNYTYAIPVEVRSAAEDAKITAPTTPKTEYGWFYPTSYNQTDPDYYFCLSVLDGLTIYDNSTTPLTKAELEAAVREGRLTVKASFDNGETFVAHNWKSKGGTYYFVSGSAANDPAAYSNSVTYYYKGKNGAVKTATKTFVTPSSVEIKSEWFGAVIKPQCPKYSDYTGVTVTNKWEPWNAG